ncbi:Hsp33 family molecular chaperone HslO [Paenibacillus sp. MSJ-34]|nr:Hsp33 family molecular chaperone HslO [Paenibacillus sp. MSJ-34]
MLYSLGKEELANAHENDGSIEIVCHMCGKNIRTARSKLRISSLLRDERRSRRKAIST